MSSTFTAAKTKDVFSGTFECRACGLEAPATVHASGRGSAKGLDMDSIAAAQYDAEMDAGGVASRTLTFVRCPNCGKRDRTAASYVIQVILGSAILGGVTAGLAFFFMHRKADREDVGMLGPLALGCGAVLALVLIWWWGRPWWRVKQRVRLDMSQARIVPPED